MASVKKIVVAAAIGLSAIGVGAGSAYAADDGQRGRYEESRRPERCNDDHDHRAHDANYYDYYDQDRYSRAGAYRGSGASVSVTIGGGYGDRNDRYDRYDDRYDRGDRYDGRRGGSQVVRRESFDTRYRARIQLVEEVVYRRGDRDLVCTVSVNGPDARYIRDRDLRRVAYRYCSPRAQVRVYA